MKTEFEMVAKTFAGLEDVLASELVALGASDVAPGNRMVSFRGDLAMLYKANFCCRTALRILKPFYSFEARDADELYSRAKEYDWGSLMGVNSTFAIDTVSFGEEFRHSQFATYRVKDAIVDWFRDHNSDGARPRVRLDGADVLLNVHIAGRKVTLSLDSSGESLHKRGWRRAQTEAPINEVLAAGIILKTGWDGTTPFVDPMCGSGTFVIEAAMIAAGIYPGVYRQHYAFENWADFDAALLDEIYNDDSNERDVIVPVIGTDISPRAIAIAGENAKGAGVERYVSFGVKGIGSWEEAPRPAGVLVTNPPYGKRIGSDDMNTLYSTIGRVLKHVFTGYHCWIIGYEDIYFNEIGLSPSQKFAVNNGGLDCELREYVIFEGTKAGFRAAGGKLKDRREAPGKGVRKGGFRDKKDEGRGRRDSGSDRPSGRRQTEDKPYGRERADARPYARKPYAKGHNAVNDVNDNDERPTTRRPFDLSRLGKQPRIPENKTVINNRPVWRVRKKDRKDADTTDNNTTSND